MLHRKNHCLKKPKWKRKEKPKRKEGKEGGKEGVKEEGRKNRRKEGKEKINMASIPNQKIKICKESINYSSHLSFEYFLILKC